VQPIGARDAVRRPFAFVIFNEFPACRSHGDPAMILVESLRRLLVAGCLATGVYWVLMPGPPLVLAGIEDFARSRAENPYFSRPGGESLDDFVRRRTAGRTLRARDGEWSDFAQSILADRPSAALQRIERDGRVRWVFEPDSLPGATDTVQQRLLFLNAGPNGPWVRLETLPAADIEGLEAHWRYPFRLYGSALLLLAVLLYHLIPRAQPDSDQLVYARLPAVVIPDWLGFTGFSAFLACYLFLHYHNLPGEPVPYVHDGWWMLLLVFTVLASGFLLLVLLALRYATLSLQVTPEALTVRNWQGVRRYPWTRMQHCAPYRSSRGSQIAALLAVLAPGPGAFGQGRLLAGNEEWGLAIHMADGERIRVMGNALPGFQRIVDELCAGNVSGSAALRP
jgi:hypothetical protein